MKLDGRIRERLAALIEKGEAVLRTEKPPPPGVVGFPTLERQRFMEWRSQCLACLIQTLGTDHVYAREFQSAVEDNARIGYVQAGLGILRGALEDVEQGNLESLQNLVVAEVFSDFLDQAQHLLENDYKAPAASLAGAVLENGLRSLAERNGIPVKDRDDLSALNNKIASKGIYNRLRRKQVDTWTEVRNAADHGRFDDFGESDVGDLIKGVRDFLATEL